MSSPATSDYQKTVMMRGVGKCWQNSLGAKKKKALGAKYRSDSAWSSLFLFIHTHLILKRISTFQGSVHKGENNGLKKLKIATEQRQGN